MDKIIAFIELELTILQSSYYTAVGSTEKAYINGKIYAYSETLRIIKKEKNNEN